MQKFIKKAVESLEKQQVEQVPLLDEGESLFFEEEDYDTAYSKASNLIEDQTFGVQDLDICDFEDMEYLCDNENIYDFVMQVLQDVGVIEDEIQNYLCETRFEDSFLDADIQGDDVEVSVNIAKLTEYLVDNEISY